MLYRALSTPSRILVGVTGRALGQRREATFLRSHSRGGAELECDPWAPDPNPQPSFSDSPSLRCCWTSPRTMGRVIYTHSAF